MAAIAIASTYAPRRCGIATFTADLGHALGACEVVALRGSDEHSRFESPVRHVIRANVRTDHVRVARSLGDSSVRIVSVQHEYGIWGGNDGEHVLDFLAALSVPAVATLHTVLERPTTGQRRVMEGILRSTAAVVVMSKTAARILAAQYAADPAAISIIPHGVPDLPFVEPDSVKPDVGLEGRRVLLSFGLVGPSKGYESVIEAMPAVVREVPNACYVVLGATHPELLRTEGESYRLRLEALTAELGMGDHVIFVDRFVGQQELGLWLEAADVFVTPYPNLEQIVSGTLSYAMAAGKPSVSTPYLYASENPCRRTRHVGAPEITHGADARSRRAAAGPSPPLCYGGTCVRAWARHALVALSCELRATLRTTPGITPGSGRPEDPCGRSPECLS